VELEEGPLVLTEIESSLENKSEIEASIASALSLYISLLSTYLLLSLSSILIDFSLTYNNMSQHDFNQLLL